MRNVPRAILAIALSAGVVLSGLTAPVSAKPPMWSSPLALGPHETTTLASRPGLLLASGKANEVNAFEGGMQAVPGPRIAGLFRSTDQGRTWTLGKAIGSGGEVSTIAAPPDLLAVAAAGSEAYAVFGSQVWRSTDDGATWRSVGTVGGQATTLDVLADGRLVAGLANGGLKVSADRGETWSGFGTGLPASRVNQLLIHYTGTYLVATDTGLYRGTGAAPAFTQVTTGISSPSAVAYGVSAMDVSGILLAMEGTNVGTAIYTSTSDGMSFVPHGIIAAGGAEPRATRGAVEATSQGQPVFYVGTSGGLFRTGNGGVSTITWERVDPEPGYRRVSDLAIEDTNPAAAKNHLVYAALDRASPVAVSLSERRMLAPGWFDQLEGGRVCGGMIARADGALFAACGRHIFRSDDGGANWVSVGTGLPYLHPIGDTPYFPLSMGADGSLWVSGYDRGLYHSNPAVTSWSKVNIPAASVGLLEPHPTNAQIVYAAGLSLNGGTEVLWRTADGGSTWSPVTAVGRTITAIDISPAAPNRVLVTTSANGGWVSEDSGATWIKGVGLPASSLYGAAFSDADPTVAWAMGRDDTTGLAFRSTDAGHTWDEAGHVVVDGQSKMAFDIVPSPWSSDTAYLTPTDGDLLVTRDAGATFERLDDGLPKDPCTICETVGNITFDPRNPGLIYVTAGVLDPTNGPQTDWVYRGVDSPS